MEKRVQDLLALVGLAEGTMQVFQLPHAKKFTLMYPNYFSAKDLTVKGITDEDLLEAMEDLVTEHLQRIADDLKMIERFRSQLL